MHSTDYCSDSATGVLHNPDLLGPWEGIPSGSGAPPADVVLYATSKDPDGCSGVRADVTMDVCLPPPPIISFLFVRCHVSLLPIGDWDPRPCIDSRFFPGDDCPCVDV